jgi:hypothetical protein
MTFCKIETPAKEVSCPVSRSNSGKRCSIGVHESDEWGPMLGRLGWLPRLEHVENFCGGISLNVKTLGAWLCANDRIQRH